MTSQTIAIDSPATCVRRQRVHGVRLLGLICTLLVGVGGAVSGVLAADDTSGAPKLNVITNKAGLPTVAIITTGGTIAEKSSREAGGDVPAVSGRALVDAIPGLAARANIAVLNFSDIDSSQMTPQHWARLSKVTDDVLARDDIAGAIITHGTDTMDGAAYFLDVTLTSDKPVVFTGAMNDASSLVPDGPANILDAVTQVLSPNARDWGATVTLNHFVNSARDVRKTQTTNVQTFMSGEKGYLGYVFGNTVVRINDRVRRVRLALPDGAAARLPDVPLLASYAGADGRFVRFAAENGADGLVIEGVGAGNVDANVYKAIKSVLARNIPVVISSPVYYGAVEPIYADEGGGKTLQMAGCILAGDLMAGKARLLLMIGLAVYGNDHAKLARLFAD